MIATELLGIADTFSWSRRKLRYQLRRIAQDVSRLEVENRRMHDALTDLVQDSFSVMQAADRAGRVVRAMPPLAVVEGGRSPVLSAEA